MQKKQRQTLLRGGTMIRQEAIATSWNIEKFWLDIWGKKKDFYCQYSHTCCTWGWDAQRGCALFILVGVQLSIRHSSEPPAPKMLCPSHPPSHCGSAKNSASSQDSWGGWPLPQASLWNLWFSFFMKAQWGKKKKLLSYLCIGGCHKQRKDPYFHPKKGISVTHYHWCVIMLQS